MLKLGPEICHVDRCPHGCTSATGCKGIEGKRRTDEAIEAAWKVWYDAQPIKPFPYHIGHKCFVAGAKATLGVLPVEGTSHE